VHTKLRLVVDLQNCAKAQASRAYARKVKMTNLQQMAQTICYVQEHGYNTKADLEYDRQMNITALNKLRNTLEKITTQISKIESSDNDEQSSNQFDILQQTRIQLLTNQKTLKQNIRNLEIISSNVDNILHFESDHQLSNDRSTQR